LLLVAFLLVNALNCHLSLVLASVVQGDAVNCNTRSGWGAVGAEATTLQTAILVLAHSTAEYCAPVWCRNILTDLAINDALRIDACVLHQRTTFLSVWGARGGP